jgi:hypothetical protein
MKPLIVYCSRTGNTEKVVQVVGKKLDADVLYTDHVSANDFNHRKLVGLASGVYWAFLDKSLFYAAELIPKDCRVFIITTCSFKFRILKSIYPFLLKRKVVRLKLKFIGNWHCQGEDHNNDIIFRWFHLAKGKPDQNDLLNAEKFASELMEYKY